MNTQTSSDLFTDLNAETPSESNTDNLDYDKLEIDFVEYLNNRFQRDDLKNDKILFTLEDNKIFINHEENKAWVVYSEDITSTDHLNFEEKRLSWLKEFNNLLNNKETYNKDSDYLWTNDYFENPIEIIKINSRNFRGKSNNFYRFADEKNTITINKTSKSFILNFFKSDEYSHRWNHMFQDIRFKGFLNNKKINDKKIRLHSLFRFGDTYSATVVFNEKNFTPKQYKQSIEKIQSCFYNLVLDTQDVLHIKTVSYKEKIQHPIKPKRDESYTEELEFKIPHLKYDYSLISFYKAAFNSSLPSQKFLDFYHIFEYLFLRVSEDVIYDKVKSYVNAPRFKSNTDEIEKLISMIKKHNTENDETEMLKKVLNKYINEDDLIDFINTAELDKNIKGKKIFGENLTLNNKSGHVIGNISTILKQVRNALVHSSDRYNREDCHIPFSESEKLVTLFIPIMDYLAQKVIAGTAEAIN